MSNIVATAKVRLTNNGDGIKSISKFSYHDDYYKNSSLENAFKSHLYDSIKDKINKLIDKQVIIGNAFYLQVLADKKVKIISDIYPSLDSIKEKDITKYLSKPIKSALEISADKINNHCLWILDKTKDKFLDKQSNISSKKKETLPLSCPITSNETSINNLKKLHQGFLKVLNYIFVKKLIHAKITDITILALFIFTILAYSLAIFAPHLGMLAISNHISDALHPVFGALNITVGLAVFTQAVKNFLKAKKNDNKEEMILALVSMLFSFAIISTGLTAATNLSNDNILLKVFFTICASFTFGVGIYNTIKTQLFRKELKSKDLKEFLKEQILISEEEYNIRKKQIYGIQNDKEIQKRLKKHLSDKEYNEILAKNFEDKKEKYLKAKLFDLELQSLQKKKLAKLEKILRNKITNRCIDFINAQEDMSLKEDIIKELNLRNFADGSRIFATTLSILALGFNIAAPIKDTNVKNLAYYITLFISKLSGCWHNYVPSWRNVPAGDDKQERKSIYTYSKIRDEKTSKIVDSLIAAS